MRVRLVFLALCGLLCATAHAHQGLSARKALGTLRVADHGLVLDLMVWMRVSGTRATRLRAQYDFDRNGQLSAREGGALARLMAPEVIGGLTVDVAGNVQSIHRAEYRAKMAAKGAVDIAILLHYRLGPQQSLTVSINSVLTKEAPRSPAMTVELSALPPLKLMRGHQPIRGAVMGPMRLAPLSGGLTVDVVNGSDNRPDGVNPPATAEPTPE